MIYNEDCRETLKRDLEYDYVITGCPDYAELDMDAGDPKYELFLRDVFSMLNPRNNVVTTIMTDRKSGGTILRKHELVTRLFEGLGYKLATQKIWIKSYKINLYRLNYAFILTFKRGKVDSLFEQRLLDCYQFEDDKYEGFKFGFPVALVEPFIRCYGMSTVYDPFVGSGTVPVACVMNGKFYIGSEIDMDVAAMCRERVDREKNRLF